MPGEPAADDGREVDGKAPVPPATHGPPLRRGLHSPEVPSGSYAGTHNDNLSGDAPAIGFPTASPVLPGVTSQVTATLTPLFQGQLLGDPAQGSSHGRRCARGAAEAAQGWRGVELGHRTADAGSARREEAAPPHHVASPGRKSLEKSIVSAATTPGQPGRGLRRPLAVLGTWCSDEEAKRWGGDRCACPEDQPMRGAAARVVRLLQGRLLPWVCDSPCPAVAGRAGASRSDAARLHAHLYKSKPLPESEGGPSEAACVDVPRKARCRW